MACFRRDWARVECSQQSAGAGCVVGEKRRAASGIYRSAALSIISSLRRKNHQTSIFTRVEGATYSSVMITGNFRQAIEGAFALVAGDRQVGLLRRSCVFMGVCAAFGTGAGGGRLSN